MSKLLKIIVWVVVIAGLIALGYVFLNKEDSTDATLVSGQSGEAINTTDLSAQNETNSVGKDLLSLLLTMKSLSLDERIFDNNVFISLKDFGRDLVTQPQGRPNPFAPIGQDDPLSLDKVSTPNTSSTSTNSTSTKPSTNSTR